MISVIAKFNILPGNKKAAKKAIKQLVAKVKKKEPDTLVYLPHTVDLDGFNSPLPYDGEVTFYEVYKDQAAFDLHLFGPNGPDKPSGPYTDFVKKYSHLFLCTSDGKPYMVVESVQNLSGFIREDTPLTVCHK